MKRNTFLVLVLFFLVACDANRDPAPASEEHGASHGETATTEVRLTAAQISALQLQTGPLPKRNISATIQVNGVLEVPPQNYAVVTAILGANVASIQVSEGDKVTKGQPLGYIAHPSLVDMQSEYVSSLNQLEFLKKEYERQESLYTERVGAGAQFQKSKSEYFMLKSTVGGYEAKLRLLGANPDEIRDGKIAEKLPVRSPITGYIKTVGVKTGQYVEPQTSLFEVVDIRYIHADFMVFEKDVHKVREGQSVRFKIETLPGMDLTAKIFAVGKAFEQDPKAVHIHAEIENKHGLLIPGMYITGSILLGEKTSFALPESAIVREGERHFAFILRPAEQGTDLEGHDDHRGSDAHTDRAEHVDSKAKPNASIFTPVEVLLGESDGSWVQVTLAKNIPASTELALNNAYYLMAEMKKGETEHSH